MKTPINPADTLDDLDFDFGAFDEAPKDWPELADRIADNDAIMRSLADLDHTPPDWIGAARNAAGAALRPDDDTASWLTMDDALNFTAEALEKLGNSAEAAPFILSHVVARLEREGSVIGRGARSRRRLYPFAFAAYVAHAVAAAHTNPLPR